jgi:hypothetical protein
MTVSYQESSIQYSPGGSTTEFAIPYQFNANGDIVAILTDADGNDTTWTLNSDYTLTGAGDDSGGTLTATTPPDSGTTLTIYRDTDQTQETDYVANDSFPASTHEAALDKLTLLVQELQDQIDRCLKIPRNENSTTLLANADTRASKYPVFDSSGNLTVTDEATISYPEDDVSISASFASGASAVTFNLTVTGASSSRIVRVWANDKDDTSPSTTPPAYNLFGTGKKYWEFIASNGANAFTLPKATTIEYKVTYEFQGAVALSPLLT